MKPRNKQQLCRTPGCTRIASVRGWCNADYQAARRNGEFERVYKKNRVFVEGVQEEPQTTECGVSGCDRPPTTRGLCPRHYSRVLKYGDPLKVATNRQRLVRTLPDEKSPTKLAKLLGVSRQRAHQLLNMDAHKARAAVAHAIQAGRLTRPDACERCKAASTDLEAHHWDYREELDVRWLCPPCHSIVHPHHPSVHADEGQAA